MAPDRRRLTYSFKRAWKDGSYAVHDRTALTHELALPAVIEALGGEALREGLASGEALLSGRRDA